MIWDAAVFDALALVAAQAPPAADTTRTLGGVELTTENVRTLATVLSLLVAVLALRISLASQRWRVRAVSNFGVHQTPIAVTDIRTVEISNTGRQAITVTSVAPLTPTGARLFKPLVSSATVETDPIPSVIEPGEVHSSRWLTSDIAEALEIEPDKVPRYLTFVIDFGSGQRRVSKPPPGSMSPRRWRRTMQYRWAKLTAGRAFKRARKGRD